MEGWVSIHRKITQWQWYSDANTARVFIHLLIMANHADGFYHGYPVKRGQRVTSPDKLAVELGLSRQKVRTSLDKLISTNEITIKATTKFSLVTIEKYDFYQQEQKKATTKTTTKLTNKQPTSNQQLTTNNNDNKEDNENKDIYRSFAHLKISRIEFDKLTEEGYTESQVDEILDRIENYKQNKKYSSLYLTAKVWLKKEPKGIKVDSKPKPPCAGIIPASSKPIPLLPKWEGEVETTEYFYNPQWGDKDDDEDDEVM